MALAKAERKKLQDIMDDPVKWAQAFLRAFDPITKEMKPWTARWYQVEMLRDKSTRKVYRCGRRIGKCLPGHVRIYDPTTGERIRVDELSIRGKAHLVTMTHDYKLSPYLTNEILDIGITNILLYDYRYPLFNREISKEEFDRKIKETPSNDNLIKRENVF